MGVPNASLERPGLGVQRAACSMRAACLLEAEEADLVRTQTTARAALNTSMREQYGRAAGVRHVLNRE
jgi:hypothetical protein